MHFLPEIASARDFDRISARGYTFGYIGSVILLIICLILIQMFDSFGFKDSKSATKFAFSISRSMVDHFFSDNLIFFFTTKC